MKKIRTLIATFAAVAAFAKGPTLLAAPRDGYGAEARTAVVPQTL